MNGEKLTADFSFELPERCDPGGALGSRDVLAAAIDVMREIPFFQQRRKDGGLFKQKKDGHVETRRFARNGYLRRERDLVRDHLASWWPSVSRSRVQTKRHLQSFRLMEKQAV